MPAVVQKNLHQVDRTKVESDIPTGYGTASEAESLDFSRFKDVDFDHPSDDESMTETEEYEDDASSIGASRGRFIEEKMRRRQVGVGTAAPASAPVPAPAAKRAVANAPSVSRLPRSVSVAEAVVTEAVVSVAVDPVPAPVAPAPVAAPTEEPALTAAPPKAKSPEKPEHFDPEVAALLTGLGLDKYISAFDENEVDMEALLLMTSGLEFPLTLDTLKELEIPLGPRTKILNKAKSLRADPLAELETSLSTPLFPTSPQVSSPNSYPTTPLAATLQPAVLTLPGPVHPPASLSPDLSPPVAAPAQVKPVPTWPDRPSTIQEEEEEDSFRLSKALFARPEVEDKPPQPAELRRYGRRDSIDLFDDLKRWPVPDGELLLNVPLEDLFRELQV